ncbi:histidine phosphatase family protein [Shimia sp.]|uniref:histidine phosphatase family protein n=1 Tax=Shimia sp. TaxID=1954381 RepID=UPI003298C351
MTTLYLVRHGPTHAKTMVGWSDLPADLSDTAAIQRLSDFLPDQAVMISSDLSRASATADALQKSHTRLPHDTDLREIHFGDWELRNFADIEATDPERIRAYWETPGDVRPPNGESWHEVTARVDRAIDRVITAHPGQDIIAVAHFGVILSQVQRAERLTAYEAFSHRIDNLSVTSVSINPSGWSLGHINHNP